MATHLGPYNASRPEPRLVGLGQVSSNTDYWATGQKQHNSAVMNYFKYGDQLKTFMCTFYLDSLDADIKLLESRYLYTNSLTIKANGSIVFQLWPRVCGGVTWTTDAGVIETGKNYMIVAQCSAFNSSILSNTSMYLCKGGNTVTNLISGMSDGDGIANPGGGGYSNAVPNYVSSYENGRCSEGITGSISGMHFWTGGILSAAAITALYNSGTPLTDPGTASGDYTSTFAGYYYDGGDFTHLSAQSIANSTELNDISNFNYLAGSGGPECTVATSGNGFSIIVP